MLKPGLSFVTFNWYDVKRKFLECTGWEDDGMGVWNCKFDKEVTVIYEYDEGNSLSHEQEYIYFDSYPQDTISLEQWRAKEPLVIALDMSQYAHAWKFDGFMYKGHTVLKLPFGIMLKYLRDLGELPKDIPIIVSTLDWAEPL